jgi:Tfp pilus assembly protein PilV
MESVSTSRQIASEATNRRNRFWRNAQAAFTIAEVGIAAALLVVGLCGTLVLLTKGMQVTETARNSTIAGQILQSEMERIRLSTWEDVKKLPESPNFPEIVPTGTFSLDEKLKSRFKLYLTTSYTPSRDLTMKDVVLKVTWTDFNGTSHERRLTSRYCKEGLYDFYGPTSR